MPSGASRTRFGGSESSFFMFVFLFDGAKVIKKTDVANMLRMFLYKLQKKHNSGWIVMGMERQNGIFIVTLQILNQSGF